jgi:hypothetical protein
MKKWPEDREEISEVEKLNDSSQEIGNVLNIWGELGTGGEGEVESTAEGRTWI